MEKEIIEIFKKYVGFESISTDSNYKGEVIRCAEYVNELLGGMGLETQICETKGNPVVMGKRRVKGKNLPHVLIYGHYDVQPVDPVELWERGPFEGYIKGDNIYGRGTADNKGQLLTHMMGVKKLLEEDPELPLNITFIVEGEEEIGSKHFGEFLEKYKGELDGDVMILSDTASVSEEQVTITTGIRGIIALEIELRGASGDLHSGLYGGAVYNPILGLTQLLGSLYKENGFVDIEGFYDDVVVPTEWERNELKKLPLTIEEYKKMIGVKELYKLEGYSGFEATRFWPTVAINGITGGYQGEGTKTVIPCKASAKVTIRLVGNQDPDKIIKLVEKKLREKCAGAFELVIKFHEGSKAYVVLPPKGRGEGQKEGRKEEVLRRAFEGAEVGIERHFGRSPLYLREGGSIPIIATIKDVLGVDSVMIGLALPDGNFHAPNEKFNLRMMERGIPMVMDMLRHISKSQV